jgi:hypothetical protein
MRIKIEYIFPDIPDTFSSDQKVSVKTVSGEILTVVRQNPIEPKTYTKEVVQTRIDDQTVSALVEWLP